ncbi:MAG: OmpP1/FadL family transporter, partial [Gammaproteobacteria bacterium]
AVSRNSATVPSLHYASPINDKLFFGFSITSPFGSSTNFPMDGIQRNFATKSSIQTINLSPSIAYKINDKFSVAVGIDAMKMDATLNQVTAFGPIANEASSWGYGWHVGGLYQFNPGTRVGLSYRSSVAQRLNGKSQVEGRTPSNALTTNIKLPAMTTLGIHHEVTSKWALMGSINYTQWNTVDSIVLNGLGLPAPYNTSTLPQNFRNTWRASVGTAYELNDKWLVRVGVGYDQTPTNDKDRALRLPDNNRWLVGIGARYRITKQLSLDGGWTRAFIQDASINNTSSVTGETLRGNTKNAADIIGLQLTWDLM